jgi:hypothetical protein
MSRTLILIVILLSLGLSACAPSAPAPQPLPPDAPVDAPAATQPPTVAPQPEQPVDSGDATSQPGGHAPFAPENSYAPQASDANLGQGTAFVEVSSLLVAESSPPQVTLALSGSLPTPCNQLRVKIAEPDAEKKIMVEVYSVIDPNLVCVQVLKEFQAKITLGSFAPGHYSVIVNGQPVGEFDS